MTVTVVCDVLGKENNGTTIAAMNLIRALRERWHTVRVVCTDPERAGTPGFFVVPRMKLGTLDGIILNKAAPVNRALYRAFYRKLYRYCDAVHYPSQFIRDDFESVAGPTPGRVISNGVGRSFRPKPVERPEWMKDRFDTPKKNKRGIRFCGFLFLYLRHCEIGCRPIKIANTPLRLSNFPANVKRAPSNIHINNY